MALDAVVCPQDPFGYPNCSFKDYFQGMEDEIISCGIMDTTQFWSYDQLGFHEDQAEEKSLLTILSNKQINNNVTHFDNWLESTPGNSCATDQCWEPNSNSSPEDREITKEKEEPRDPHQPVTNRRKRRRTKTSKNKEEVENQRMTHIAVERNRRKQMNEYLAVLRSLMPSSYAQRGDQASIIGGAINFVKELEQLLLTLEAEKSTKINQQKQQEHQEDCHNTTSAPFASFFTFPQYATTPTKAAPTSSSDDKVVEDRNEAASAADIEVTMVESHANVKIQAKRCSKQLVKLVGAFQSLRLTVQHLIVSSHDHMVLYSVSVKVEEGCKLNSVDEIAAAVNKMLRIIQEESVC